jgi:purine-binding chemotaxis protein CheW
MIPVADTRALMGITFWAGTQRYALPIDRVREIQQIVAFAEVPDETGLVLGMVDVRGEIVPVVDIRTLIGLPREPYTLDTPMIVMLGAGGPVALIVDAVDTVVDLPAEGAGPAPVMHSLASRILGVHHLDDGLVFVLDADALLEPVELPVPGESRDE